MITKATLWADPSALEIVLGNYRVGTASRLVDPSILAMAQEYRRLASARMVAMEPKDIDERLPDDAYHVSRKVDGEFTMLVWRHGQLMTINPGGTVRVGMPWQEEAVTLLKKAKIDEAVIAGELYGSSSDDRRPRVHDIVSMARLPRDQAELERIGFAAFDVVSLQGATLDLPFAERWKKLEAIFQKGKRAHLVESHWIKHPKELGEYVERWIQQEGAEGIVARSDTAGTFKIKLRHELDLAVLGFTESTGDRQGMLHDLLLGICRHDGTLQIVSRVGGGFTEDQRREMLSDLKDMVVDSQYTEVNSDHVAYQMVKPQWVVEVSCLDVLSQTTRGAPVQRMVLDYHEPASRYEVVRPLPLATLISPQFIRKREDKRPNPSDVRIQQISDRVEVPLLDQDAHSLEQPKSQVLLREVYVKEAKGQKMVRKFVVWETNKAKDSDEYLAYALHFTDFSPNRKTPLERDVRVSNSLDQIHRILAAMKEENLKAGWKPVS